MKRKLSLVLASLMAVTACAFTACKDKLGEIVVPEYESDKIVDFVAYAAPTKANWNGSASNAECITDEQYKLLADAGFTRAQALYDGLRVGGGTIEQLSETAQTDALRALACAEKVGIKYYVRDWTFYGFVNSVKEEDYESVINKMFDENNEYVKSSAYAGNFLHDEPNVQQMEKMSKVYDLYKAKVPSGEAFINLLPDYASAEALDTTLQSSYEDYIDRYLELFAKKTGYISYDYYPLNKSQFSGSRIKETYLQNYELVATKAKEWDIEPRIYIQNVSDYTGIRDIIGIQDLRFQIYTGMAFGFSSFTYYTYFSTSSNGSLIAKDGTPTYRYYAALNVNNEVHAWEKVYRNFTWQGVMTKLGDEMLENVGFNLLKNPIMTHERINSVSVTEDTVIGVLKDGEGRDGFMFVNYSDPYFDKTDKVTVKFNNARAALMYRRGQKMVVPLNKGEYTFKLTPGEGRFIIPLV